MAARIVWFDAFVTNVDRTPRNPNLLVWGRRLWLDRPRRGALHSPYLGRLSRPQPVALCPDRDHILLPLAAPIADADADAVSRLPPATIEAIVSAIPEGWLGDEPRFATVVEHRAAYVAYLLQRLAGPRAFVEEAEDARAQRL